MDAEIPVLSGHLIVPTQSGFSINRISKKKSSNIKYCLLFRSSRHGIERLEICDSKEDLKNSKIVTLENCVKITQEPQEHLINIVTKTGSFQLSTQTDDDLTNWVTALKSVAFKDKNSIVNRTSAIEEDNDLYCSSYSDGEFTVKLIQTDTTIRCNLEPGTYLLELAKTELQLRRPTTDMSIVAKWPYRYIRKYGYRDGKFTFEAGRKCDTGEGVFCLDHQNPQQIFRCMAAKMKTMKNLIKGENLNNSDCGTTSSENHLNAAISMEAGSRSPIPLSAQSSINHNLSDFDSSILTLNLNQCSASNRGFISSNDSLNATTPTSGVNGVKTIPNKPPRSINTRGKFQNYEPITPTSPTANKTFLKTITDSQMSQNNSNLSLNIPQPPNRDYECIETRTDAWRLFGIDEVKHTEHVTTPEDDLIQFVWQRSKSQKDLMQKPTNGVTETTPNNSPHTSPASSKSNQNNNNSNNNNNNNNSTVNTKISPPPLPPPKLVMDKVDVTEGDYDRLEFFGTNSKICSTYTTIITVVPPTFRKQISQPISSNDYELIGGPDIQSCRLADDSYLGYGVLRKPSGSTSKTLLNEEGILDHRKCNGLDYAIVSKPKRV